MTTPRKRIGSLLLGLPAPLRSTEKLIEARHPLILCEMHSDANERFMRDYFVRFGYGLESVDALHVLAIPQAVEK